MQTQVVEITTYDTEITNPADLAEVLAESAVSYEGVIRSTVIIGDTVVTRNAVPAEHIPG